MKSGNLNFLETSGPLQACKGADLPVLRNITEERRSRDKNPLTNAHNKIKFMG